jgi:hypothetical protein
MPGVRGEGAEASSQAISPGPSISHDILGCLWHVWQGGGRPERHSNAMGSVFSVSCGQAKLWFWMTGGLGQNPTSLSKM